MKDALGHGSNGMGEQHVRDIADAHGVPTAHLPGTDMSKGLGAGLRANFGDAYKFSPTKYGSFSNDSFFRRTGRAERYVNARSVRPSNFRLV